MIKSSDQFTEHLWQSYNISYKYTAVAEIGGRKLGAVPPPFRGGSWDHLTQCGLGRGLRLYQVASWSIQPFCYNRHGPTHNWRGVSWVPKYGSTMWPGPRTTSVPSGIWSNQPFGHNRHGSKIGGLCPFGGGELGPHLTQEAYLHAEFHLDPCSHLATIDMGRKLEVIVPPLWGGELGPQVTQCRLDRGLPARQVTSWSIQPFGHNRHGQSSAPFLGQGTRLYIVIFLHVMLGISSRAYYTQLYTSAYRSPAVITLNQDIQNPVLGILPSLNYVLSGS